MTAPNPFEALAEQIQQTSTTSAVISALACIRRASAVLEAASVDVENDVPFTRDSIASIAPQADPRSLLAPVIRAQAALARFAADPETGELPDDEDEDRAQLLAYVAEMVMRAEADADDEVIREWADWCSSLLLDTCQHLDTLDGADPDDDRAHVPGPMTAGELQTQADVLSLLRDSPADVMPRISELTETERVDLLAQVAPVFGAG